MIASSVSAMMGGTLVGTGRPEALLTLSGEEREALEHWARRPTSAQALAQRCRIVLACAEGLTNQQVAAVEGVNQITVCKSRARASWSGASTACTTSRGRASRARLQTPTSSG